MRVAVAALVLAACTAPPAMVDTMDTPLAAPGDATRGRALFVSREGGHCVLCHAIPGVKVAGDVGPPLAGIASRLTLGQIRLRVADITTVKPYATMPVFHRTERLVRVPQQYAGKPALTGQQVEDLVAYLGTLR